VVGKANAVALQHFLAHDVSDGCDDRCHLVSLYTPVRAGEAGAWPLFLLLS
jgi:hypothetical protein